MPNNINVDFSQFPFCFRGIYIKGKFSNKLKDYNQFFKFFSEIIEKILPVFSNYSFENIHRLTKHAHIIPKESQQYETVILVLKELCKDYYNYNEAEFEMWFNQNINDYAIWQLGIIGGVRLIGIRKQKTFFCVLFIDYHHQLYKSEKHNQENIDKYEFCPITSVKKEKVR